MLLVLPASLFSAIPLATKIGGLIYLTNTDGRTLTGHNLENSLADYGAYARNHPAAHEQGLRLIIAGLRLKFCPIRFRNYADFFLLFWSKLSGDGAVNS
jgi:tRNA (guanine26-N2/guanine27-N2)-dimethyltransferase